MDVWLQKIVLLALGYVFLCIFYMCIGEGDSEDGKPVTPAVVFKYHEGITNAVRRNVYIRQLL